MDDNEVNMIIAEFMWGLSSGFWDKPYRNKPDRVEFDIEDGSIFMFPYSKYKGLLSSEMRNVNFTGSLDALVPVLNKLDGEFWLNFKRCGLEHYNIALWRGRSGDNQILGEGETIQQAAAHATAKAIQELNVEI